MTNTIKEPTIKNFNGIVDNFLVNVGHGNCYQNVKDGMICYAPKDPNRKIQIDRGFWFGQIVSADRDTQNLLKLFLHSNMMQISYKISNGEYLLTDLN